MDPQEALNHFRNAKKELQAQEIFLRQQNADTAASRRVIGLVQLQNAIHKGVRSAKDNLQQHSVFYEVPANPPLKVSHQYSKSQDPADLLSPINNGGILNLGRYGRADGLPTQAVELALHAGLAQKYKQQIESREEIPPYQGTFETTTQAANLGDKKPLRQDEADLVEFENVPIVPPIPAAQAAPAGDPFAGPPPPGGPPPPPDGPPPPGPGSPPSGRPLSLSDLDFGSPPSGQPLSLSDLRQSDAAQASAALGPRGPDPFGDAAAEADAERNLVDYGLADAPLAQTAADAGVPVDGARSVVEMGRQLSPGSAVRAQAATPPGSARSDVEMGRQLSPGSAVRAQAATPPAPQPAQSPDSPEETPARPLNSPVMLRARNFFRNILTTVWDFIRSESDVEVDSAESAAEQANYEMERAVEQRRPEVRDLSAEEVQIARSAALRDVAPEMKSPVMRRTAMRLANAAAAPAAAAAAAPPAPARGLNFSAAPPGAAAAATPAAARPAAPGELQLPEADVVLNAELLQSSPVKSEGPIVSEANDGNSNHHQKVKLNLTLNGRPLFLYSDNGIRSETRYDENGKLDKPIQPAVLRNAVYTSGVSSGKTINKSDDQLYTFYSDDQKKANSKRKILWVSFVEGKLKSREFPQGIPRVSAAATPPNNTNTAGRGMTNSPRKRSRFEKGSQEAKDHMAKLREMRKKQKN